MITEYPEAPNQGMCQHMDVYKNNNCGNMAHLTEPGEEMKELFFIILVNVRGPFLIQTYEIK
jgi:hypothetical protein